MIVTGAGGGAVCPTLSVVVQSAFPYRMLGTANAARQFFNNLGAVMGVPVMATIVIETLKNELPRHLPAGSGSQLAKAATSGAQGLIAGQNTGLTEAFGKSPGGARAPGSDRGPGEPVDRHRTGVHPGDRTDGPGLADDLLPTRD